MYTVGMFPIITNEKYFLLQDRLGVTIRSFTVSKYTLEHVRSYREGFVKGLNSMLNS